MVRLVPLSMCIRRVCLLECTRLYGTLCVCAYGARSILQGEPDSGDRTEADNCLEMPRYARTSIAGMGCPAKGETVLLLHVLLCCFLPVFFSANGNEREVIKHVVYAFFLSIMCH